MAGKLRCLEILDDSDPDEEFELILKLLANREYQQIRRLPNDAKSPMASGEQMDTSMDESSYSTVDKPEQGSLKVTIDQPAKEVISKDSLLRRAQMYQEYMKQISVPTQRGSIIPFTSWTGLALSIKQLYHQPLHYLTNIRLKQWDQLRIGAEDEDIPLDTVIHPSKAETTIWLMEEVHRRTSSYHHLAKLWLADPLYHASIDPIFPNSSQ